MRTRSAVVTPALFGWALLGMLVPTGCSDPRIPDGRYVCNSVEGCPSGFSCHADGLCYAAEEGTGGGAGGGVGGGSGGGDAGVDGPCIPAPATHVEGITANDPASGGVAETTGITLTSEWQTISGCIDPSADEDAFVITVPDNTNAWLDIHARRDAGPTSNMTVNAKPPTAPEVQLLDSPADDAHGRPYAGVVGLSAGQYMITVGDEGPLAGAYRYTISLRLFTCAFGGSASATETNDGASSRGNDVLSFNPPNVDLTAASDSPEQILQTIASGPPFRFGGTLASIASSEDGYGDRDAVRLVTGTNVHALVFHAGLDAETAVDLIVSDAEGPFPSAVSPVGRPTFAEGQVGSTVTSAAVAPNSPYLVWLGGYPNAGAGYLLTVCAIVD